jgi:cysteine-rich repeat protein
MANRGIATILLAVGLSTLGCGASDEGGEEDFAFSSSPLVAGSNATVVSNTIPLQMAPGEKVPVQVVMRNTGAASPVNDWPFPSSYALHRTNTAWSWTSTKVSAATPVGSTHTFNFVITAPITPGTYTFGSQMRLLGDSLFGQVLTVPNIQVNAANTPQYRCAWDQANSDLPSNLTPGQPRTVSLRLTNTGSQTWQAGTFYLRSQDTPVSFWGGGGTALQLTQAVAPSESTTFTFSITAPSTPGVYSFKRQVSDLSPTGIGFFAGSCVDRSITVGGTPALDATLVSQDFPTTMAPGDKAKVTVVLSNPGTQTWAADGNYGLYSRNNPVSLWGVTNVPVVTATAQGQQQSFVFTITAPTTPGNYTHAWKMRKFSGADAGYFGVNLNFPVTVDGSATPSYASSLVSQTIPARMLPGSTAQFLVTFQNTGTLTWSGPGFGIASNNTPPSIWGPTSSLLPTGTTVATNQQREFVLNVTAPTTPGTYDSRWRMRDFGNGTGQFGAEAVSSVLVTRCGDSTLDAGEACDDGNWTNGDGCSDVCAREGRTVDLAAAAADRTITGSQTNKQLASVTIGNVRGGTTPYVIVSENRNVALAAQQVRNTAGVVTGFTGDAGFFTGASNVITSGFAFEILGSTANDRLGYYGGGGMQVADVTGDGTPDLVIGAPGGDGEMDARLEAGEVYVLTGGAGLTGTIDLKTAPAVVAASVIGEAENDALRLITVGDVTGDGTADLILGSTETGATAGAIYVVAGGSGLTGTVDLAAPGAVTVYKISGLSAGAALGGVAAVGNVGGSSANDLLLGAPSASPGGLDNAGAAYAVFGPISGNIDLSSGASVTWVGAGAFDKLGSAVAIGDVSGDGVGDALITATQARKAGTQVGTVDIWRGGLSQGSSFDLASALPDARLLGRDAKDTFGTAVEVGDFTGDGIADIVVAAASGDGPANDRDGAGELVVLRGGASIAGSIDLSTAYTELEVYGQISRDLMGGRPNALALGNIDSDARVDVCVGSHKGGTAGSLVGPGRVDCFRAGN